MNRTVVLVPLIVLVAACTSAGAPQPAGQTQGAGSTQPASAGGGGAGGTSLVDAAAKVKDVCTLMPADQAARLVPGGAAPQSAQYPSRCTVTNQVSVLEITLAGDPGTIGPFPGAEQIPGLAAEAYLEAPLPDDSYLIVVLGKDPTAMLYVEVAGHDGKNHKADAIAVAQAVIAKLQASG